MEACSQVDRPRPLLPARAPSAVRHRRATRSQERIALQPRLAAAVTTTRLHVAVRVMRKCRWRRFQLVLESKLWLELRVELRWRWMRRRQL